LIPKWWRLLRPLCSVNIRAEVIYALDTFGASLWQDERMVAHQDRFPASHGRCLDLFSAIAADAGGPSRESISSPTTGAVETARNAAAVYRFGDSDQLGNSGKILRMARCAVGSSAESHDPAAPCGLEVVLEREGRPGRPQIPAELRVLIRRMARENSVWGEERIASEWLVKLGIQLSPRTVRKYMPKRSSVGIDGDTS
jgi:hypothetical protein